jgi:NitT/TauT family transport system substrate-binding protein
MLEAPGHRKPWEEQMTSWTTTRIVPLIPAATLLLAACTSAATAPPSAAPTAAPTAGSSATTAPTATPLPGSKQFSFAFTSPGLSSVAIMEAISILKGQGYTIDTPSIAQANLAVEGVINGQFQVTAGSTLSYLIGAQKGSPIRIVGNRNNNENTLTVTVAIQKCADLAGKVWAHGGESATSTFMGRNWAKQNCPGTVANEIQMPGSDLRAAAMAGGQVDAAEIEVADAVGLTTGANASKFHVLASFANDLPNLKTSPIAANATWAAQNPGDLVALLRAVIAENRKINADATGGYLKSLAQKWVPNVIKAETIDAVAKTYVERKLFPTDAGITTADVEYTIKFLTDAGVLSAGLTTAQAADLTFVNLALKELGS